MERPQASLSLFGERFKRLPALHWQRSGKQFGRRASAWFILKIDICKLLPVIVAHDIAGVQFLDKPGRREKRRAGIKPSSGHNMRNCLVVRRVGEWENDNETSCPFDCALSFSGSGRQYDCASVLSSPASSLLASWRWRLLLELLSR